MSRKGFRAVDHHCHAADPVRPVARSRSSTCAKARCNDTALRRRKVQSVSWSEWASAHSSRITTFSWVAHSIWRLENTPVARANSSSLGFLKDAGESDDNGVWKENVSDLPTSVSTTKINAKRHSVTRMVALPLSDS